MLGSYHPEPWPGLLLKESGRCGDEGAHVAGAWGISEDAANRQRATVFAGVVLAFQRPRDGRHRLLIERGFDIGRPTLIAPSLEIEGGALRKATYPAGGSSSRTARSNFELSRPLVEVPELDTSPSSRGPGGLRKLTPRGCRYALARLRKEKREMSYNGRVLDAALGACALGSTAGSGRGRLLSKRLRHCLAAALDRRFRRAGRQWLRDGRAPRRGRAFLLARRPVPTP